MQVVKAIDAVSREQLVQIAAALGVGSSAPIFSMVPLRSVPLLPTITEEDRAILNNVEKVMKFLTSGTSRTPNQVSAKYQQFKVAYHLCKCKKFSCIFTLYLNNCKQFTFPNFIYNRFIVSIK